MMLLINKFKFIRIKTTKIIVLVIIVNLFALSCDQEVTTYETYAP